MRKRPADISFYEWRVNAWRTSDSFVRLDATGRGIYRDLLDQCYVAGDFELDKEWICNLCRCTMEQLEAAWPKLEKSFPARSNARRYNALAEVFRKQYFAYVNKQKKHGKSGAEKRHGIKEMDRVPQNSEEGALETLKNKNKKENKKENEDKATPPSEGWELVDSQPGYWADRWYSRHPKKKDLVLAFPSVQKLFESGGIELMRVIESAHSAWCESEQWRKEGGQFAPTLARWLEDLGWTGAPPQAGGPVERSKFAAAFNVFDKREKSA